MEIWINRTVLVVLTAVVFYLWRKMNRLSGVSEAIRNLQYVEFATNTMRMYEVATGIRVVTERLRQDAWKYVVWLHSQVGRYGSRELGWILDEFKGRVRLSFKRAGWYQVTVGDQEEPIWWIEEFAKALMGNEGEKLLSTLEQTKVERTRLLAGINSQM